MQYHINPRVWKEIYGLLCTFKGLHVRREQDVRRFVEGVWFVLRGGCQWRLLPRIYGKWRSVHARFTSWGHHGVWETLAQNARKHPDNEAFMIDATIVRAHACAAGYTKNAHEEHALGRSRGGFSTKIHALVDGLGYPLKFLLTGGQRHDITQGPKLIEAFKNAILIGDKGYDSSAFISLAQTQGLIPVIPPRRNRRNPRTYDAHWYKERHLIECFFGKIKHFRRIFSRFDKTAQAFLNFLNFASTLLWLR